MKFIHISDLHLGKRVNEISMLEDQDFILAKIIDVVDDVKPDGVIIAGDVYDKPVPPSEAVQLFDDFLYKLSLRNLQVFVISGNHDSAERVAFGARLFGKSGIHISPVYDGKVKPVALHDTVGAVNIYLMPFVKPANVRRFFPDDNIETYTDAMRVAIREMNVNTDERNIIVCHQFVTGASRSDSEEISVGGIDNVDTDVFDVFDYVALGHLHGPQKISRETIRYSGTPLKYSFSECNHKKSVTVVEFGKKGDIKIELMQLSPKRDMREIRGTYGEITERAFLNTQNRDDFLHITLTDEEDVPNAIGVLGDLFPNLMKLDYDNTRTRTFGYDGSVADTENKSPFSLFSELYEKQNGQKMSECQEKFVSALIEKIWDGEL